MGLADRCEDEVVAYHDFLADWLAGRIADTPENRRRATEATAEDFEMYPPSGVLATGAEVADNVAEGHGVHADAADPFEIDIRNVRVRHEGEDCCLLAYEEWQSPVDGPAGRTSTAFFRRSEDAPGGVEWVHVHSTWIPDS